MNIRKPIGTESLLIDFQYIEIEFMIFSKKTLALVLFGASFVGMTALAESTYLQEYKMLEKDPLYAMIFDRNIVLDAREVAKAIANAKNLKGASLMYRPHIGIQGGIVVNGETMPTLYGYVNALSKERNIETPTVMIIPQENFFNAFSSMNIWSGGAAVFLGENILQECSDGEIEAVIAREIGHVEYNHGKKLCFLDTAYLCALCYLYQQNVLTGMQGTLLYLLVRSSFFIGKKFEREADNFACLQAKKAKELMLFCKRLEYKEAKENMNFDMVFSIIDENDFELDQYGQAEAGVEYFSARIYHSLRKYFKWLYSETPYGVRPTPAERIANAQRIVEQQA